jgi:hypothetical protein
LRRTRGSTQPNQDGCTRRPPGLRQCRYRQLTPRGLTPRSPRGQRSVGKRKGFAQEPRGSRRLRGSSPEGPPVSRSWPFVTVADAVAPPRCLPPPKGGGRPGLPFPGGPAGGEIAGPRKPRSLRPLALSPQRGGATRVRLPKAGCARSHSCAGKGAALARFFARGPPSGALCKGVHDGPRSHGKPPHSNPGWCGSGGQ